MTDNIKEIGKCYERYANEGYEDRLLIKRHLEKIVAMICELDGPSNSICRADFVLDGGYVEIWDTNDRTVRVGLCEGFEK